jgi:hypothetical protein
MGICIQRITGDGPKGEEGMIYNLENGYIWVIMRRDPNPKESCKHHDYHIQGIATTEEVAVGGCRDENYFIGPLPVNTALPHKLIEWVGAYFPLALDKKPELKVPKKEKK